MFVFFCLVIKSLYQFISMCSEELKEKYEGKLTKELTGPTFEVLGKVMRAIINRKVTTPGGFIG